MTAESGRTWSTSEVSDLDKLVPELVAALEGKKVITVSGEMGSGKTTLIKAICKYLGVTDNTSSPTFSLVNEYHTKAGQRIFHFDFYRIQNEKEAYDMGYEEYFYSGDLCLIEWPENIPSLVPADSAAIHIAVKGASRIISLV